MPPASWTPFQVKPDGVASFGSMTGATSVIVLRSRALGFTVAGAGVGVPVLVWPVPVGGAMVGPGGLERKLQVATSSATATRSAAASRAGRAGGPFRRAWLRSDANGGEYFD